MAEVCNICAEKYNKVQRKKIECQYCNFDVCRACYQRYCLDQRQSICMNCKKIHSFTFFIQNVSNIFYKTDWNKSEKSKLFEMEQARFPETQFYIEDEAETKAKIDELTRQIRQCELERSLYKRKHLTMIRRMKYDEKEQEERKNRQLKIVSKCPVENCNGLIMTNYKCGICHIHICKECHEIVGEEEDHKCDPGKVETIKFIRATTKACPKCNIPIHKIEGCDQMYCTICHTAFSYSTGLVETGRIHNPHYYEYLRSISKDGQIRREDGDGPCGPRNDEIINDREFLNILRYYPNDIRKYFTEVYRNMLHIEEIEKRAYNAHLVDNLDYKEVKRRDVRAKYLLGEITKVNFEKGLRRHQKNLIQCEEVYPILDLVVKVTNDILKTFTRLYDDQIINDAAEHLEALVKLCNTSIENVEKTLKITLFQIGEDLRITRIRKEKKKKPQVNEENNE